MLIDAKKFFSLLDSGPTQLLQFSGELMRHKCMVLHLKMQCVIDNSQFNYFIIRKQTGRAMQYESFMSGTNGKLSIVWDTDDKFIITNSDTDVLNMEFTYFCM